MSGLVPYANSVRHGFYALGGHFLPLSMRWARAVGFLCATWLMTTHVAPALAAQELTVDLDASKTKIAFVLSDVLHTVNGTFRLKEGRVTFDASTGTMSGEVVVDAASGNSGSRARDKRMTRDILEAQRYPEIRFTPSKLIGSISEANTSSAQVTGSFSIHGQAHEITIPVQVQMSQDEVMATGKFIIPYVHWGMKNPSNFLLKVNDKVEIEITAAAHIDHR